MALFEIINTSSGLSLGIFEAPSDHDALDAMAREAGYANHADAQRATGDMGNDLMVVRSLRELITVLLQVQVLPASPISRG